jgi:DNA transposition AAA+ family ATPase
MTKPTTSPTPSSLVGTDLEGIFLQFLESEFSADALTESADFIPTDAARTIIARLKLAQAEKFAFALVHGPAGAGKSSATRWYARSYGCVLLHAQPQYDPSALLDDLAVNLRITRTRVFRQMVSMVRDRLQQKP